MTENTQQKEQDAQAQTLGLMRWVGLTYMVGGLFVLWLLDKIILLTWSIFAEPNPTVVSAIALGAAAVSTFIAYKHERLNELVHEVVGELSRVTWPGRDETTNSTVVVIITSIIAALILGGFDAAWSAITDLIYKA
ncbi:MAG: preprotein translocase subunit SecE [Myxococcales bacterium]|nr:preprotein translocase subunit SecE [Myxococcales bacterium]